MDWKVLRNNRLILNTLKEGDINGYLLESIWLLREKPLPIEAILTQLQQTVRRDGHSRCCCHGYLPLLRTLYLCLTIVDDETASSDAQRLLEMLLNWPPFQDKENKDVRLAIALLPFYETHENPSSLINLESTRLLEWAVRPGEWDRDNHAVPDTYAKHADEIIKRHFSGKEKSHEERRRIVLKGQICLEVLDAACSADNNTTGWDTGLDVRRVLTRSISYGIMKYLSPDEKRQVLISGLKQSHISTPA